MAARLPWRALPPALWLNPMAALGPGSDAIAAPWPRLLIASGRQTVAVAAAIRRRASGATFAVQLLDPRIAPSRFDLVVAPEHDGLAGDNVIATKGALHGVNAARLRAAAERFRGRLAALPRPLVAVLVGGSSAAYRFGAVEAARLAGLLRAAAASDSGGFAVTASRRTGADALAALRAGLGGIAAELWDGTGENPYLGYLALADVIVVTADSVNMVSEAAATGKPVHVFALPGGNAKFRRFHAAFAEAGITRPFEGRLARWSYAPLDETARVAALIRRRLALGAGVGQDD
jgi:mitochondrial fission protein ELM1